MQEQNSAGNRPAGAGNEQANNTKTKGPEASSERFSDHATAGKHEEDIDAQTLRRLLEP